MVGILQGFWTKIFKHVTLWNNHDCYLWTDKYITSGLFIFGTKTYKYISYYISQIYKNKDI